MNTDKAIHSWRDLADQLTIEQINQLERYERESPDPTEIAAGLLDLAREHARDNLADMFMAHVPTPAGAVKVWPWQKGTHGVQRREFDGTTRRVKGATVYIGGRQHANGTAERWIAVECRELDAITAGQARRLAAALNEAADEIEALSTAEARHAHLEH